MSDEMDDWLGEIEPGSPLHDAVFDALEANPLLVSDQAVDRVASAALAQLAPPARVPWLGLAVAALAVVAVGAAVWTSGEQPVQLTDVSAQRMREPAPPEAAPAVVLAHREAIAARLEAGDAYGAWHLFLAFRSQYGPDMAGMERDLGAIALALHRASRAPEPDDLDALEQAGAAYAMYLADYPSSERDDDMRYAYAEMLYKADRHADAYREYMTVVSRHPDSPHAQFCAESALFAADQLAAQGVAGASEQGIAAAETWLEHWPLDPKATAIRYKAGYLHYAAGDTVQAETHFLGVLLADPTSPSARQAAALIQDGYVVREDWAGLADSVIEGHQSWPEALGEDVSDTVEALIEKLADSDPERAAALRGLLD